MSREATLIVFAVIWLIVVMIPIIANERQNAKIREKNPTYHG
jgi:hypothetical protein